MVRKYSHLTYEQRCQIYALKRRGDSVTSIARALGVHHCTISRELKRNRGRCGYRYSQAQKKAQNRRSERASPNKKMTTDVVERIEKKIRQDWSPKQISGWLKRHGYQAISHETIYKHIWAEKKRGGDLYKHLRHRGKKYNRRRKGKAGRGCIPDRVDIKERPSIVEEKNRVGDWEGDTVIGKQGSSVLVTMVDRKTKLVKMKKAPRKTTDEVIEALITKLTPLQEFVLTATLDNGKEFAAHKRLSKALETSVFFATPYRSWERGLNEHTNGLIRQYFPKGTNFDDITDEEIERVEKMLNTRPRESLSFETPLEMWERLTTLQATSYIS